MASLDPRLQTVATFVDAPVHVDVGSDHGQLLVALLRQGRIARGIAIENKRQPWGNSCRALQGLAAEVRFGDGLAVLAADEAASISLCGIGGHRIARILEAYPERVPPRVIVQANCHVERVRRWGLEHGFHLTTEVVADPQGTYPVLCFEWKPTAADPVYEGLDRDAALLFGPHLLPAGPPAYQARLREEHAYWQQFERLDPASAMRQQALASWFGGTRATSSPAPESDPGPS